MDPPFFTSKTLNFQSFVIFFFIFAARASSFSYFDHCNSHVPEAIPTETVFTRYPFLEPVTSHYTGGQAILGPDSTQRSIMFQATQNLFKTTTLDTYKIQARLTFVSSNIYQANYSTTAWRRRPLVFFLDGFWSVSTKKLCMIGSARWYSKDGHGIKLDAILKLNFARHITLVTSLVSGILESLSSPGDLTYFEPISIIGFPRVASFKYNYTLVSNEKCIDVETRQDSSVSMQSIDICLIFTNRFKTYELEHPGRFFSSFVSLYAIQCSFLDKKLRVLLEFQDRRFSRYDQSFNPDITLIGEGTWNGTRNELCIVACRILNRTDPLGGAGVGDCSTRLSLWYPAVRSIKNTSNVKCRIWTTKTVNTTGYFEPIKFKSFAHSVKNYGSNYEFTQYEKVRRFCPSKNHDSYHGDGFLARYYRDLTFDMSVKRKTTASTGFAAPIFIGSQFYGSYMMGSNFSRLVQPTPLVAHGVSATRHHGPVNISYEVSFANTIGLNLSSTHNGRVEISAEGVYDSETRQICMIGCRNLVVANIKNDSWDCEILVRFKLPSKNVNFMTGSIESLRERHEALFFDRLDVFSLTYTESEAKRRIWRMDLEIIMVLVSDTLACVFIGRQLFHTKREPETVRFSSVLMMVVLTIGHMVPLLLNFEAIFLNSRERSNIQLSSSSGWLEVNEVVLRVVKMVAFLLQFRVLQLTWNSKHENRNGSWVSEIRILIVTLPLYLLGGLVVFFVNRKDDKYTMWGGLRSYAGLILDGFLFPQLILNVFEASKEPVLSHWFYVGITFVRLLPHGYDLYRGTKSITHQFDRFYLYTNPQVDFYSKSWDIIIICGGATFAVIVFLQQRFGGRFMFPKRFWESSEYEMVPVAT